MTAPGTPKKGHRSLSQGTSMVAQSHYPVDDQRIYCIQDLHIVDAVSSQDELFQEETFNMLVDADVDPLWITAEEALRVPQNDPHFYVTPVFTGTVFSHLEKTKSKVLSSSLIRKCLQDNRPIPKKFHPVFSFHLEHAKVCFTGLPKERRDHLARLVRFMNGTVEGNYFPSITHLVTDKGNSSAEKYRAAKTKRIPVMKPEWIEDAWEQARRLNHQDYTDPETEEKYLLPIFHKMTLCTSGINGAERADLTRLIELNGGRSPGEMRRGECTHLITEKVVGAKYTKAKEWGDVKVVNIRWVRKSVEQGYIQDESKFDPAKPELLPAKNSTQRHGAQAPRDLDISSIYGPLKHTIHSFDGDLNLTAKTVHTPITPATMPRNHSKRLTSNDEQECGPNIDKLLDTTLKGDFDFFEGCSIFVAGIDKIRQEKFNRILDRCGATRVNSIERATHIAVVTVKENERPGLIEAQARGIAVLRHEWLMGCIEKKEVLCTDEYIWDSDQTVIRPSLATSVVGPSRQSNDLPLQSRRTSDVGTTIPLVSNRCPEPEPATISLDSTTFLDCSFRMHLLDSELADHLQDLVERHAGFVLGEHENGIANFLVAGQAEFGRVPDVKTDKYKYLITENFIRHCIDNKTILDSRQRPLFRPLPAVSGSRIFENVVVGFVSVGTIDKFTLSHIVNDFGGTVEAAIVTRPRDNIKVCTHIVAGKECPKIDELRRKARQVKIVDPSWIIDCVINDTWLQEAKYIFKGTAYDGYPGRDDDFWQSAPLGESVREEEMQNVDPAMFMETPRAGSGNQAISGPLEIDFTDPLEFQKCPTSTPKGLFTPQSRQSRRSLDRCNPRFQFEGVTQLLNEIPSPAVTEEQDTLNSFSVTQVGKMLSEAALKTGKTPTGPIHAATDPTSSRKTSQKDNFYRASPRRSGGKEEKPLSGVKQDPSEEVALSTRLMQKQMTFLAQLQTEPDEGASRPASLATQPAAGLKRKRPHELIQDSPAVPPAKRTLSVMEPTVDWHPSTGHALGNDVSVVEKTTSAPKSTAETSASVQVLEDDDGMLTMEAFPPVTETAAPREAVATIVISENVVVQPEVVPQVTRTRSSTRRSKELTDSPPVVKSARSSGPQAETKTPSRRASIAPKRVFLFTGVSVQDKLICEDMAASLGGEIAPDTNDVPEEVTHLICGKLIRGSKLMGCIASGRWVLTKEYLEDSREASKFLEEEPYEWGNPHILGKVAVPDKDKKLAEAARRWRIELGSGQRKGVFDGWKVLLYAPKEKASGLVPLLQAGKAEVVVREQLKTSVAQLAPTHVIMTKSPDWNQHEMKQCIAAGAKIYSLDYISTILTEVAVREEEWYHMDYRVYLRRQGNL